MFEIGDEVICVDAGIKPEAIIAVSNLYPNWVVEGKKYIARGFTDNDGIVEGMWLEEIRNPEIYIDLIKRVQEPAFGLFRFRKSEESYAKEEVSVEEKLLLSIQK